MLTDFGRWCDECDKEFTQDEWDNRHTTDIHDWHEGCCPECWGDDPTDDDPNHCEFPGCAAQQAEGEHLCGYHDAWLYEAPATFERALIEAKEEMRWMTP